MFTFALNVMLLVYTVQMHIFGLIKKNCYSLFLFQNARQKSCKNKAETHKTKKNYSPLLAAIVFGSILNADCHKNY